MLKKLNELNPHINIQSINGISFKKYGNVHHNIKINDMLNFLLSTPMSDDYYLPDCTALSSLNESNYFKELFYGGIPCQIGYFNSYNTSLNALEYHKCNEILITGTDVVVLLSSISNLENFKLNSNDIEAFLVPKNTIIELYSSTLHFAPCMATSNGIRQIVILSQGTNTPLTSQNMPTINLDSENKLLFEKNKWVIAHTNCHKLVSQGAFVGILGDNIKINYIK